MFHRSGFVAICLVALLSASPAQAVITRLTPLKAVIDDSDHVVLATVESVDPAKPSMTLTIAQDLKGTLASRRMPVLLKGGTEGNPKQVLDRVKAGTELVLFMTNGTYQIMVNAFTEGSWFQIIGQIVEGTPRWGFTHGEPYLRRTYKGTTQEMKSTIAAYLNEKKSPPAPIADEKPGFGPTLEGVAFEPWSPKGKEKGADGDAPQNKDNGVTSAKKDDPTTSIAPSNDEFNSSAGATRRYILWASAGIVATAAIVFLAIVLRKKAA